MVDFVAELGRLWRYAFRYGQLDGKVSDGGAFRVAAIDRQAGTARGKIGQKPVAAGSPNDVDARRLAA